MSKKEILIQEAKNIISSYSQRLTLRQIYYRLVAKLVIPNTVSQYKYLSSILVEARKQGKIRYDAIEDRTRSVQSNATTLYTSWRRELYYKMQDIKEISYTLPKNLFQPKVLVIGLEKQALEGIFKDCLSYHDNTILVVCRGYNSLTQVWELAERLKDDKREIHCRFFSDFDPSGLDIQRNFIEQCKDLGIVFKSFKRVALNRKQIKQYGLPYAPTKKKDSRSKSWSAGGVVELDALDPNILTKMILKTKEKFWDKSIDHRRKKLEKIMERRLKKHYKTSLINHAKSL
nr:MAG: DNA topoisomerase IV alpha subunit [Lokiarchaeota virus Skoll Meg22_1214]